MKSTQAQRLPLLEELTGGKSKSPLQTGDSWNYMPDPLDLLYWRTFAIRKSRYDYEMIAQPLTLPVCPGCAVEDSTLEPTGTLVQRVHDEPRENLCVSVHFIRQRFQCSCGRNLLQPLPGIVEGHSITVRGAAYVALECFDLSFDKVAEKVGISSSMAKELFADLVCGLDAARVIKAPEVLGIDGVCVGRRRYKRSYCLLTDLSNSSDSKVLELLPKSTEIEVARFITQLPDKKRIKIIVIDMSRGFLNVAEKLLPHAKVVIDPFHVLRMLNDAVTKAVRMKQQGLTSAEHKRLMSGGNRFLLLKRRFELTEKQKEQLADWFQQVPELKEAYDLKEAGYDIYKSAVRWKAEKSFEEWAAGIPDHLKPAFKGFVNTVSRWRQNIFNYFDHKVSNAFTESKNRDIKSLQRHGRRTSFPVLRAKLLYADVARKPPRPKPEIKSRQIRQAMKEADAAQRPPDTWDPHSYVARINNARKETNEFSRLLRPHKGWLDRFGHFSYYSKEKSTHKWDFIWPVSRESKKSRKSRG